MLNKAIGALVPNGEPGEIPEFSREELRLIAGALGSEGAGREVEAYVLLEQRKWAKEKNRASFLAALLDVVRRELELLEFYSEGHRQTEFPMPSHVKVVNVDTGRSDEEIPIEDFLALLKSVSSSSVFKK